MAAGVFGLTLAVAGVSVATRSQLGFLLDEWLFLGAHLQVHGNVGFEGQPTVFRPPGYPAFLAVVLDAVLGTPPAVTGAYLFRAAPVVYATQTVVLAGAAALLFWWLSARLSPRTSFVAAAILGTNPYTLVLAGLLHYSVLHVFLMVAGCLALHWAAAAPAPSRWRLAIAGLVWGVATLVRPVSLILPPFVLLLAALRWRAPRHALSAAAVFTLGLCAVVLPWTARNYVLTGRVIPVNAQMWTVFWRTTVTDFDPSPNHFNWYSTNQSHHVPILARVTGEPQYNYRSFVRRITEIEDTFQAEALHNLKTHPGTYLYNCLVSLAGFGLKMNTVFVQVFEHLQTPGARFTQQWFVPGHPQDFHSRTTREWLAVFFYVLTALALIGAWRFLWARDPFLAVPAAVGLCFAAAHVFVYLDMPYFYVRLPFLLAFAFHTIDGLKSRTLWLRGRAIPADVPVLVALGLWSAWLTARILA